VTPPPLGEEAVIRRVLTGMRTWAVVGASPSRARDSNRIAALLKSGGGVAGIP
jgi:predicted CoA-binding protein